MTAGRGEISMARVVFALIVIGASAPVSALAGAGKVAPGEHPRLFFGKRDVENIRKRAQTDEGKIVVARMRELLRKDIPLEQVQTIQTRLAGLWAAGQAFAYTISGDQADADAAMKIVRTVIEMPVINMPELRRGTRYMGIAIAYDLCYDAWPADFREKVAGYLAARAEGLLSRKEGVKGDNPAPQSNHNVEGRTQMGVIALAILGDKGAGNNAERIIAAARKDLDAWLDQAIGDHGWGTEGEGFTLNALNCGVLQFAMAYQNVMGEAATRDPSLEWILPLIMMRIVGGDMPYYGPEVSRWNGNPDCYGSSFWVLGAGATKEEFRPALRAFYTEHFGTKSTTPFTTENPSEAIYLLRSHLTEGEAKPLEQVLPKAAYDKQKGFLVFRNAYRDADDCLAVAYLHSEVKGASWKCAPSIRVRGLGQQWLKFDPTHNPELNKVEGARVTFHEAAADGSGTFSAKGESGDFAFAVDYSGKCGAPAMFVFADAGKSPLVMEAGAKPGIAMDGKTVILFTDGKPNLQLKLIAPQGGGLGVGEDMVTVPASSRWIATLQSNDAPAVKVIDADKVSVGNQIVRFTGGRIAFGAE